MPCEICPAEGVVSVGVPQSCTDYTLCINGLNFDRQCAPGTLFDASAGRCNLQELVDCAYVRCPEGEGIVLAPDPTDCQSYLVCVNGNEVAIRTCDVGMYFHPELLVCMLEEEVECLTLP